MTAALDLTKPEFRLRARGSSVDVVLVPGEPICLAAELDWLLMAEPGKLDIAQVALAGVSERVAPGLLLLSFGNAVGRFSIPGVGTIEVVSAKANGADFDRLLSELMELASALPFAPSAGAAMPFDRSVTGHKDVLYHAFVYLRWVLSDKAPREDQLLRSLRLILRDPHRKFERTREQVPVALARNVDSATLLHIATGAQPLERANGRSQTQVKFVRVLRGHVPLTVDQVQVVSTVDTPENRFVKAFLRMVASIIEAMRSELEHRGALDAFGSRLAAECASLTKVLHPILSADIWDEVGRMVHVPVSSTVLQRRNGYRDAFRHFARLRLAARVPLSTETIWDLLEARDIAELYELWCFFKLVQLANERLGPPVRAGGPEYDPWGVKVRWGLSVQWRNGTSLMYNPRFSLAAPSGRYSYSVPLRPDIGLHVPVGQPNAGLHLLDAKFRVDRLDQILGEKEDVQREVEERRGTYKRADLYKMHTYRDAIPAARSVWILYPGTETRFFSAVKPGIFDENDLPTQLLGVGAVPMPLSEGAQFEGITRVLNRLFGEGQHFPSHGATPSTGTTSGG